LALLALLGLAIPSLAAAPAADLLISNHQVSR
jgi:hypothetical protein